MGTPALHIGGERHQGTRQRRGSEDLPPGLLSWATVHGVQQLEGPKTAVQGGSGAADCVFAAGRLGVRRWLPSGR